MGYGTRALEQLTAYYEGKMAELDTGDTSAASSSVPETTEASMTLQTEQLKPRKNLPPLLSKLSERRPERLHYLGVSFGLTPQLLAFWRRSGFLPVYLRLTELATTGEHTAIMLKALDSVFTQDESYSDKWLTDFYDDFAKRFVNLCGFDFRKFDVKTALAVLSKARPTDDFALQGKSKLFFGKRDAQRTLCGA